MAAELIWNLRLRDGENVEIEEHQAESVMVRNRGHFLFVGNAARGLASIYELYLSVVRLPVRYDYRRVHTYQKQSTTLRGPLTPPRQVDKR